MNSAAMSATVEIGNRWKPYPAYKDSGAGWLGEIPEHWEMKKAKYCLRAIEQGWSPQCENRPAEPEEWGVLKVGCVNGAIFDPSENKALPLNMEPRTEYEIRRGDVLMSRANTRELLGSASVVAQVRSRLLLCDKLYRLKVFSTEVDPIFLVLLLGSTTVRFQLEREATGASDSMQNISMGTIRALIIPVPQLTEQRLIASFLDRETAHIDALIAKKERLIELLTEKQTALISHAVTKGLDPTVPMKDSGVEWLGDIPVHWEILSLRRVVDKFVDYRGKTPEKVPSGIPLITARNIKNGRVDFSLSEEFIRDEDYDEWMVRGLPEIGDVLITTEAPLGESALVDDTNIALAQRIILIKTDKSLISNDFLKNHFTAKSGTGELWSRATGSTAIGIKASHLKETLVVVPPLVEQKAITRYLDHETSKNDALISKVRAHIEKLKEYRIAIISAAVTGKIDVRGEGA